LKRQAERYNAISKPALAIAALEEALAANRTDGYLLFELGKAHAALNQLGAGSSV
jgi:hypothetical protein